MATCRGEMSRSLMISSEAPSWMARSARVHQFGQGLGQVPARLLFAVGEQGRQHGHLEVAALHGPQTLHVLVRENGVRQLELPAMLGRFVQQVPLLAGEGQQRHHQPFPQGVDGRVGHLGEQLLEVVEQQLGLIGEHGQRRVGAHRAHRLLAVGRHGADDHLQVFPRVAEGPQTLRQLVGIDARPAWAGWNSPRSSMRFSSQRR